MNPNSLFTNRSALINLCQKYGITYLGLFGSYARGEEKKSSDIDILIDYNLPKSYFELADIQIKLSDLLEKEVDLVRKKSLKPILKPFIEKDLMTIYEQN